VHGVLGGQVLENDIFDYYEEILEVVTNDLDFIVGEKSIIKEDKTDVLPQIDRLKDLHHLVVFLVDVQAF